MAATSSKFHKTYYWSQIFFRILAIGTTLSSACVMLTNKQSTVVYGIHADASYTYSSTFKFFAGASIVVSILSILLLIINVFLMRKKAVNSTHYFLLFILDLMMTILLMAGLSATMAIAYVGKYGNTHTGWVALCDNFGKFCNKANASIILGCLGVIANLILTVTSAYISRKN